MSNYKKIVETITNLNWDSLDGEELQQLMILSAYSALEFAESLRLTLNLYPSNTLLKKMASEEIATNNLKFDEYEEQGDHSQFLWHFIDKFGLRDKFPAIHSAGQEYIKEVRALPPKVIAMSIVSRENELPGIFTRILTAKEWTLPGLKEYKYYLKRHIFLDSHEGGHADMLKEFDVDDQVTEFYRIRLNLYKSIPKLFKLNS